MSGNTQNAMREARKQPQTWPGKARKALKEITLEMNIRRWKKISSPVMCEGQGLEKEEDYEFPLILQKKSKYLGL